jgi:hypothetical protein
MKLNKSIGLVTNDFSQKKIKIFQAYHNLKKIDNFSSNDDLKPLIDIVGKWRFYVGIKEDLSKEELFMNVTFIRENFGELNLVDINEAINLSLKGELKVDVEHYQNFSPIYISKILLAYKEYRSKIIVDIRQRISEKENSLQSEITDEERLTFCKKSLQSMYDSKNDKGFYDFGSVTYDFIKKNKLMVMSKELVDEAMAYGTDNYIKQTRNSFYNDVVSNTKNHKSERDKKDQTIRSYARNYVVKKWLDGFNVNQWKKFLNEINISMI